MADETEDASEGEVGELATDSLEAGLEPAASDDPKTREYYIQQLPLTPEDIQASNIIIEDGLYNMAMIYKDKLEDIPLATEAFEELERRFPKHSHLLESYYQVYLMALRSGNKRSLLLIRISWLRLSLNRIMRLRLPIRITNIISG